ncbi:MAG: hypothetical protein IIC71_11700 [Acidobacteria bacterium]|nr:hypothetical protein [Acidobacteriota bacterium]
MRRLWGAEALHGSRSCFADRHLDEAVVLKPFAGRVRRVFTFVVVGDVAEIELCAEQVTG